MYRERPDVPSTRNGTYCDALRLAVEAHAGQFDKNGEPYINHPLRVVRSVTIHGKIHSIVAILHDVVEDTPVTFKQIYEMFGYDVWEAVHALTRRDGESYSDFIKRCKANEIARVVKIADIQDNLRPGAPHLVERYERALKVLQGES